MKLPKTSRYHRFAEDMLQLMCETASSAGHLLIYPHILEMHNSLPKDAALQTAGGDAQVYRHRGRIRIFLSNLYKHIDRSWCVPQKQEKPATPKVIAAAEKFYRQTERKGFFIDSPMGGVLLHEMIHLRQGAHEIGHNAEFVHLTKVLAPLFGLQPCFHLEETTHWPFPSTKYGRLMLAAPTIREQARNAAVTTD